MEQRKQFFEVLKNIFIGAKIEGNSGYVNLMRIKSRYYQSLETQLYSDIDAELKTIGYDFVEEMYNKLYTFFRKYFSESGSIYFSYTPLQEKVYERIYRDDRDVALFWKTNMLYYIKTERLFQDLTVEENKDIFVFSVAELEHKKNNEKKDLVFELRKGEKLYIDADLHYKCYFNVKYAQNGSKTNVEEIQKCLKNDFDLRIKTEEIEKAFAIFRKQSEVDFFINKNAREFLREQFSFYLKSYLLDDETLFSEKRLSQLKSLQKIAFKVIDLVSQFEDELVRIWNKPKFAHSANYVLTLDKIASKNLTLLDRIWEHANFAQQAEEWAKLGMLAHWKGTNAELLREIRRTENENIAFEAKTYNSESAWRFLPLDTRYFKDLELDILGVFDDLEAELDGWLIHSENYQALNTLKEKFRGKIQTIYIDPPYNTNATEIIYTNGYKHSSWITLMENRLKLGHDFMGKKSVFCLTIDDLEYPVIKILLDDIFGNDNYLATALIRNNPSGRSTVKGFAINHEYALFYSKTDHFEGVGRLPHNDIQKNRYSNKDDDGYFEWENLRRNGPESSKIDRPKQFYPIFYNSNTKQIRLPEMIWKEEERFWEILEETADYEISILPIHPDGEEKVWRYSEYHFKNEPDRFMITEKNGKYEVYRKKYLNTEGMLPRTWWDKPEYSARDNGTRALANFFDDGYIFDFAKAPEAVMDSLLVGNLDSNSIVLDYFGGSGTTAHATVELNKKDGGKRKYILVEVGDHFYNVIIPRMKKISFSDKWKEGIAQEGGQGYSHFFKYFELEQYEESLQKTKYEDKGVLPTVDIYTQYLFLKDLKMAEEALRTENGAIKVDWAKLHPQIDIAETLSHLLGKPIKRITPESVIFADNTEIDLGNIDYKLIRPLVWW